MCIRDRYQRRVRGTRIGRMGCECRDTVILAIMGLSSLVFLAVGAIFVAPYWLFDGTSFLCSTILGVMAVKAMENGEVSDKNTEDSTTNHKTKVLATATCGVAAVSILVEVGFMVTAIILWKDEMNPYHRTSYGKDGNSFFFCSLYSSICNLFVVRHFYAMRASSAIPLMTGQEGAQETRA
eukprot:TRINITY_DN12370_c0_g1_i1.p1 TRINITY_DN12370_c0_g1~~TRINITY_DN12370_c0_g1_i1.p1  ORF type:complete len:181 (-),score=33.16 TRINITY_DN12370_c0_g1_i1:352-894(-)